MRYLEINRDRMKQRIRLFKGKLQIGHYTGWVESEDGPEIWDWKDIPELEESDD